jgi:hypothetical protein
VFPSWAEYRFKWEDLPLLFPSPEKYGTNMGVHQLKALGYAVSKDDHEFADGPLGGGVTGLEYPTATKWSSMSKVIRTASDW